MTRSRPMLKRAAVVAGAVAAITLAVAGPADAHVTVNPNTATQGGYTEIQFRMPNEEDKANTVKPTASRGVSSLLQGTRSAIIPQDSERMARRQLNVIANEAMQGPHETEGHANGCCHGNGSGHGEDLLSLGPLPNGCGS